MNQNSYHYPPQQNGIYYHPQQPQQPQQYLLQQQIKRDKAHEMTEILTAGLALGAALIATLVLQVIGVSFLQLSGKYELFEKSFLFQHSANIIIVDVIGLIIPFAVMSLLLKNRYTTPVIPREKVKFGVTVSWVGVGLAICMGANFLTNFVIQVFKQFGYELTQFETLKPNSVFECILMIFSTAIVPAICEEFAMRCTALGALRKHGKAFAVVAVSIVFGLLHGNVIQFVFAFIIGLILGYVTIVTDSVIPAMFIHGLNNGLSVFQDILAYAINSKNTQDLIVSIVMIAYIAAGVGGLIYLLVTKQFLPKKEVKQPKPYKIHFLRKLVLLIPGLILPFAILIYLTSKTIVPIS